MNENQEANLGAGFGMLIFTFIGIIWNVNKFLLLMPILAYFIAMYFLLSDKRKHTGKAKKVNNNERA